MENDTSFCEELYVVLWRTTRRFVKNYTSFKYVGGNKKRKDDWKLSSPLILTRICDAELRYLLKVYSKTAPSWANRAIFRSIPPAYPHKLPDEPMTR